MRTELFWSYVPSHLGPDACWPWSGETAERYPGAPLRARYAGRWAARIIYEETVGPIPSGLELDHLCNVPLCVNPDHLEPVTHAENMRRAGALTQTCAQGHAYTPENTYTRPTGGRDCRMCIRGRARKYQQRKRNAERVPA